MIDFRPHRNTPTPQLEAELGQLHDRMQSLLQQIDRAPPGSNGAVRFPSQLAEVRERRAAIFNELRRRRRQ